MLEGSAHFRQIALAVSRVLADVSSLSGPEFFPRAVMALASATGADHAYIGQLSDDGARIETLAYCADRKLQPNFEYEVEFAPCAGALGSETCVHFDRVADRFEKDPHLREMHISGYVGMRMATPEGRVIGLTASLFRTPIPEPEVVTNVFQILAGRISAEMISALTVSGLNTELEDLQRRLREKDALIASLSER